MSQTETINQESPKESKIKQHEILLEDMSPETLYLMKRKYAHLTNDEKKELLNTGFIQIAKMINYNGSLICWNGGYKWDDVLEMLCDLKFFSKEEAFMFLLSKQVRI